MTATINAQTGAVVWLPFTVCCWAPDIAKPLEFRVDSRLLIVHGSRNESGVGTYNYVFDGKAFKLVRAQEKRRGCAFTTSLSFFAGRIVE